MKRFLAVAGLAVLTLIVMDLGQIVTGPVGLAMKGGQSAGLAIMGGQAMAADLYTKAPPPPPPPPPVGKGKAPIIGKGKGKAPVVTSRY
jgi:hypothetical protein